MSYMPYVIGAFAVFALVLLWDFLAPRLQRFLADYPRFRVRISSSPWTAFAEESNADVEICNGYGDWSDRQVERLTSEHWLTVCSPATLERRGWPGSAQALMSWPLYSVLGYREGWNEWLTQQQSHGLAPAPGLEFDTTTRMASVGGQPLALTPRELAVLEALLARVGRPVAREALFEKVFDFDADARVEAIEIYVSRLRKKLEGAGVAINTLRGLGYLLAEKPAA